MSLFQDNCRSIRNLLPLHVGGDLDAGPARRVDEHLHHCLSCFREFRELTALRQRLGVLAEQQPPAGALDHFTEEVMARIALGERGPAAELPGVRRSRPSIMLPLAAAATLMVGVLLGYVAQTRSAAVSPAASPILAPSPVVSQTEGLIPTEVRGSPVDNRTRSARGARGMPWLLDDLGIDRISPEQNALNDSTPLPALQRLQLMLRLNGRSEGLSPEPDRQLRLRAPEPLPPAQDG